MFSKAKNKAKIEAAKEQEAAGFKILTPKQILQRLPIALALVKFIKQLRKFRKLTQKIY